MASRSSVYVGVVVDVSDSVIPCRPVAWPGSVMFEVCHLREEVVIHLRLVERLTLSLAGPPDLQWRAAGQLHVV